MLQSGALAAEDMRWLWGPLASQDSLTPFTPEQQVTIDSYDDEEVTSLMQGTESVKSSTFQCLELRCQAY